MPPCFSKSAPAMAGVGFAAFVAAFALTAAPLSIAAIQHAEAAPLHSLKKPFSGYTHLSAEAVRGDNNAAKPNFGALKEHLGSGQCVHPAPPRGWDSFDAFPIPAVFDEATLLQQAALLSANYGNATGGGYEYAIIDEGWAEIGIGQWMLDGYGRPIPNTFLFPSSAQTGGFGPLAQTLAASYGLKLGLWMIKGIPRMAVDMKLPIKGTPYTAADIAIPSKGCSWHADVLDINMTHPGGQAYYDSIAELYVGEWGVSYLKIDCVFGTLDYDGAEAQGFSKAVNAVNPAAIVSLSPGIIWDPSMADTALTSNAFRITGDLHDCWSFNLSRCILGTSIVGTTMQLIAVAPYLDGIKTAPTAATSSGDQPPSLKGSAPRATGYPYGSFPDPDMVPLGVISVGLPAAELSFVTRPNMARYIYGMWSITRSPIILGGEMQSVVNTPYLSALYANPFLTAMHACSANPSVLLERAQDANGDKGMVVWALQHGTIANTLYVGAFAFSNNPDATYADSVTLSQEAVLAKYSAPSTEKVSYFMMMDVFTGEAYGEPVLRVPGGTLPAMPVGANDATIVAIIAFS